MDMDFERVNNANFQLLCSNFKILKPQRLLSTNNSEILTGNIKTNSIYLNNLIAFTWIIPPLYSWNISETGFSPIQSLYQSILNYLVVRCSILILCFRQPLWSWQCNCNISHINCSLFYFKNCPPRRLSSQNFFFFFIGLQTCFL